MDRILDLGLHHASDLFVEELVAVQPIYRCIRSWIGFQIVDRISDCGTDLGSHLGSDLLKMAEVEKFCAIIMPTDGLDLRSRILDLGSQISDRGL